MSFSMQNIGPGAWGGRTLLFDTLPSTNQWVLEHGNECSHGDLICTFNQTSGRGRFERKWDSPENKCITLSLVIDCSRISNSTALTQAAAVAISYTLRDFNIPALLKWPNDIIVSGSKIAGILAEKASESDLIALGIGLNVNQSEDDFKRIELLQPATSMAISSRSSFDLMPILSRLKEKLEYCIDRSEDNPEFISDSWKQADYLQNKEISIFYSETTISGKYAGVNSNGQIMIESPHDGVQCFWSGDVSLKRPVQK